MEDTSERLIINDQRQNEADYYVYLMHIASYEYAKGYSTNKTVLDYGCGTGYGTNILAKDAISVTGVDISDETINYAQSNFSSKNTNFLKIENEKLPFEDNSFDLVTSFQVIEHVFHLKNYLHEIKRVLKPGGLLLITTPDKETRLFSIQNPWNYFHITEFSSYSLNKILSRDFTNTKLLKIGGEFDLVNHELKRRKITKIITLPFTLKIYPHSMRRFFLGILRKLYYSKPTILSTESEILKFSEKDIIIGDHNFLSTDLLSISEKSSISEQ